MTRISVDSSAIECKEECFILSHKAVADTVADSKAGTIPGLLEERSAAAPAAIAFHTLDQNKVWQPVGWEQFLQATQRVGAKLADLGIRKGDRVGIMAATSLDWEYAQMGALSAGAVVAGIDPAYPADQLSHVIENLDLSVLFVQDRSVLTKIPPELRRQIDLFVFFEDEPRQKNELSMMDLLTGKETDTFAGLPNVLPEDEAVIVFSSGTTGMPKAITFTHRQVTVAVEAIVRAFNDLGNQTVFLCWLPLSNLFQRIVNFCAMKIGASSYMLSDPRDLMRYVRQVNPDVLIGVPKVFERVYSGVTGHIEGKIWPIHMLAQWAMRTGYRFSAAGCGQNHSPGLADRLLMKLAEVVLLHRLRMVFGSRIRYLVSGSAAMPVWLLEWFDAIGLPVYEVYGISENVIPVAVNSPAGRKLGTVGKPLLPNEVQLAEDGEILVRGPGLFNGYLGGSEESNLRFSREGYWHTGDLGQMDADGFLSVTGRKNDVFKTSAGKWIAPSRIEEQLRHIAYVEQSVVFQHESDKIVAIVIIDPEKCAQKTGVVCQSGISWLKNDIAGNTLHQILEKEINMELENLPLYQRPVCIAITDKPLTVSGGGLTVNMKVRRNVVARQFSACFDNLLHKPDMRKGRNDCPAMSGPTIFFI